METVIAVFTLNGCGYCSDLKRKLNNLNIPFHDIEITVNRTMWENVMDQTGSDLLPTVFIQTDRIGNGFVYTPERDFQDIDEIIEIIKKNV